MEKAQQLKTCCAFSVFLYENLCYTLKDVRIAEQCIAIHDICV